MKYSYYPGCTLKTKAKELDRLGRLSAEKLGVELEEIENWQCCGAVYPEAEDEIATKLSAVRTLDAAKQKGKDLITLCSACHHVLKRVNNDMRENEYIRTRANNYMKLDEAYSGETEVIHYLEMLRDAVGFDTLKKAVVNPLKNVKIAAYYGCLLLRPSGVMAFDDPEDPSIIEDFIKAIGATPVKYSQRNECCGGYIAMEDKGAAQKRVDIILKSAKDAGADVIITACPLCMYNLDANATSEHIPVKYFTELLAEALGVKEGRLMSLTNNVTLEDILRISGANPSKCMQCGKCSGACPNYDEMEYHPHQFVAMVRKGQIERLMASESIYKCLSCFACLERCPRNVEPSKLIEAVRLAVIRQQGANHMTANDIPAKLDDKLPQQAIVSAMRKYSK